MELSDRIYVAGHRGLVGSALTRRLQALGYRIEWHDYPMEHSVCIEEVRALEAFLRRVLAA